MIKIYSLLSLLLVPSYAVGSEMMTEGTVLSEDSYVFSLDEAQELRMQIIELESSVASLEGQISEYKALDENLTAQNSGLEDIIDIKELQVLEYKKLHEADSYRLRRLERRSEAAKFERWGFFCVGVGLALGSILIADKVDDSLESTSSSEQAIPLFNF